MTTITLDDKGIERLIAVGALPRADGISLRKEEPLFSFNSISRIIGVTPETLAEVLIANRRFAYQKSDGVTCSWMGVDNDVGWRLADVRSENGDL
jgi:hypothetical protein